MQYIKYRIPIWEAAVKTNCLKLPHYFEARSNGRVDALLDDRVNLFDMKYCM